MKFQNLISSRIKGLRLLHARFLPIFHLFCDEFVEVGLRTATSMTLREQTIGRGLRLPYGKRTGVDKVDKLIIVAHDKFQEIIDAANQPDSIIKRQNIIEIDPQEIIGQKEVITSTSNVEQKIDEEQL